MVTGKNERGCGRAARKMAGFAATVGRKCEEVFCSGFWDDPSIATGRPDGSRDDAIDPELARLMLRVLDAMDAALDPMMDLWEALRLAEFRMAKLANGKEREHDERHEAGARARPADRGKSRPARDRAQPAG